MKCKNCNGTGRIYLFSSVVDCDCKKSNMFIYSDFHLKSEAKRFIERLKEFVPSTTWKNVKHEISLKDLNSQEYMYKILEFISINGKSLNDLDSWELDLSIISTTIKIDEI